MPIIRVDPDACSGCLSCVTHCSQNQHGHIFLENARLVVELDIFDGHNRIYLCRQCKVCLAARACKQDAISRDERGVWIVDEIRCIGCGECTLACPFKAIRLLGDKAYKCEVCKDALCAEVCFTDAIVIE